jgi:hypothetical protein
MVGNSLDFAGMSWAMANLLLVPRGDGSHRRRERCDRLFLAVADTADLRVGVCGSSSFLAR